ncbi:hypothetical protein LN650_12280 [Klebsiella pneumoniae subsp. pneumoniae]|nr:hypothetical protein [Klebsiella pneumoniae subsp. pneumoniae]
MNIMHPVLRRIDLNLLPVFGRGLSLPLRYAWRREELAMSTSALSHALSRLRSAPQRSAVLPRRPPDVPQRPCQPAGALHRFGAEVSQPELTPPAAFVPAASTDCMQIAITDFTAFCVFPTLMHHLQREAPGAAV